MIGYASTLSICFKFDHKLILITARPAKPHKDNVYLSDLVIYIWSSA